MEQDNLNKLDAATQARLRALRDLPVDVSSLRGRLEAEIERGESRLRLSFWRRPLVRVAAMLLLSAGVLSIAVVSLLPSEAVASADQFAALHQQMQSSQSMMVPVTDMQGAEQALRRQWSGAPDMPDGMPHEQMACCVHRVAGRKAAVVSLRSSAGPVTMAVADAKEVAIPREGLVTYNGREYSASSARGVNMVMFVRSGKSVCIMGESPREELLKLADAAKF